MKSILDQLSDDDSILLMYLAGELSPQDRLVVDQRLKSEPALRGALERLRITQDFVDEKFDEASGMEKITESEVRRVGRMMRQWQVTRLTRRQDDEIPTRVKRHMPFSMLTASLATAAVLVLGVTFWWVKSTEPDYMPPLAVNLPSPSDPVPDTNTDTSNESTSPEREFRDLFEEYATEDDLTDTLVTETSDEAIEAMERESFVHDPNVQDPIDAVETQIASLQQFNGELTDAEQWSPQLFVTEESTQ